MKAEDSRSEPSLLTLARSKRRNANGSECSVATLLRTHPRAAEITDLLEATKINPETQTREIQFATAESILESVGIHIKALTLSRHVRRRCSCS